MHTYLLSHFIVNPEGWLWNGIATVDGDPLPPFLIPVLVEKESEAGEQLTHGMNWGGIEDWFKNKQ